MDIIQAFFRLTAHGRTKGRNIEKSKHSLKDVYSWKIK